MKWFDKAWLFQWFTANASPRRKPHAGAPTVRYRWFSYIPGSGRFTEAIAATKSEARAHLKYSLGYRDRLPVGTVIVRTLKLIKNAV